MPSQKSAVTHVTMMLCLVMAVVTTSHIEASGTWSPTGSVSTARTFHGTGDPFPYSESSLRSRSVIADHLHADAARPAHLEQITGRSCGIHLRSAAPHGQEDANDELILFTSDRAFPSEAGRCASCEDIYMMPPTGELPGVPSAVRLTSGGEVIYVWAKGER